MVVLLHYLPIGRPLPVPLYADVRCIDDVITVAKVGVLQS